MTSNLAKRPDSSKQLTGRLFLNQYIAQEKTALRASVIAGALSTLLLIFQWVSFVYIAQDVIVNKQPLSSQLIILTMLLGCIIGRVFLTRLQTLFSQKASLNIRKSIRNTMLAHWRSSSPVVLKNTSSGAFASQFVEEVEAMDGYFSKYWPQQALAIISPLLILSAIAVFNWLCALLLLISAPLIPLFMILVGMGAESLNQKYSTLRQRLAGHFLDRVSNLSNILLLGAKDEILEEVEYNSERYRHVIMKTLKVAFLSSTVLEFFTSVAIASLAIYIGFSLYGAITWGPADSLSLFSGLTILILAPEFFQPLRTLSQYYHDRASALGAANNLVESLTPQTITPKQNPPACVDTQEQQQLIIEDLVVGFDTPLSPPLNLTIDPGTMVVISGDSGSGKTTLLNTIANFIPAFSGSVKLKLKNHSSIAYLPQKPWIKNNSLYENLKSLAPLASKSEMEKALEQLGLLDELGVNRFGLETLVGEHGQGLSGGQMQRMAFARILLNPSPVIIFDEPTAQLDLKSRQLIYKALTALKPERILLIASHDPLLIDACDLHLTMPINVEN